MAPVINYSAYLQEPWDMRGFPLTFYKQAFVAYKPSLDRKPITCFQFSTDENTVVKRRTGSCGVIKTQDRKMTERTAATGPEDGRR